MNKSSPDFVYKITLGDPHTHLPKTICHVNGRIVLIDQLPDQAIVHYVIMRDSKVAAIHHCKARYNEALCGSNAIAFTERLARLELETCIFYAQYGHPSYFASLGMVLRNALLLYKLI